jgi:hypothetical protein
MISLRTDGVDVNYCPNTAFISTLILKLLLESPNWIANPETGLFLSRTFQRSQ